MSTRLSLRELISDDRSPKPMSPDSSWWTSMQRLQAAQTVAGTTMAMVALVTVGCFSVPASPLAFAALDLRVGLALLCSVLFVFGVGLLARGRLFDEPGTPPWRSGNPQFRAWAVWGIGITGTGLIAFTCVAGSYLILRSTIG